jgi:hypothetical protein
MTIVWFKVPTQYPQNQQFAHRAKYLHRKSRTFFTIGTSKVTPLIAMELNKLVVLQQQI